MVNVKLSVGQSIPSGYVIGRLNGGVGDPELISIAQLSGMVAASGYVMAPGSSPSVTVAAGTGIAVTQTGTAYTVALAAASAHTIKSNITAGSAVPVDNTLTAVLDAALGNAQGDIVYRGASTWTVLTPGTSGQVLQTQGVAANPIWASASAGSLAGDTDVNLSAPGNNDLLWFQTSDSKWHNTTFTAMLDTLYSISGSVQGHVLYRGSSAWNALLAGTSGQFLQTQGDHANPVWATVAVGSAPNGMLPLVNGDLPGPSAIADGSGQFIGVPL